MRSRTSVVFSLLKSGGDPAQALVRLALRKALLGCESVLDVGCGPSLTMRQLGIRKTAGLEGFRPSFEEAKRLNAQDELVHGEIRQLSTYFQPGQFDACVALDVIEHLNKKDGLKLMQDMESIAKKRVVFFTPSGFLPQGHTDSNDLQVHLSGWEPAEMQAHGYSVFGLLGPKALRGEYYILKRRPRIVWAVVSLAAHFLWTRRRPERAAAILCVKSLQKP